MSENSQATAPISDESLRTIVLSGRQDLLQKLSTDELKRGIRLARRSQHQGPGAREEAQLRLSAIRNAQAPQTMGPSIYSRAMHGEAGEVAGEVAKALPTALSNVVEPYKPPSPEQRAAVYGKLGFIPGTSLEPAPSPEHAQIRRQAARGEFMLDAWDTAKEVAEKAKEAARYLAGAASGRPAETAVVGAIGATLATDLAKSFVKTVNEPYQQAQESPGEFLFNVADITGVAAGAKALSASRRIARLAGRAVTEGGNVTETIISQGAKSVDDAKAAAHLADSAADRLAQQARDLHALGRSDLAAEIEAQIAKLDDAKAGINKHWASKQAEVETAALEELQRNQFRQGVGELRAAARAAKERAARPVKQRMVDEMALEELQRGRFRSDVDALRAAARAAKERAEDPPSIAQLSRQHMRAGVAEAREGRSIAELSREAMRRGEAGSIDTELAKRIAQSGLGAALGAAIMGNLDEEGRPTLALAGAVVGGATGFFFRSRVFSGDWSTAPLDLVWRGIADKLPESKKAPFLRLMTEQRGLPEDAYEMHRSLKMQAESVVQDIRDTAAKLQKADPAQRRAIQDYARGALPIQAVPEKFRRPAAEFRYHLDNLGRLLIENEMVTGKLAETIKTNMGAYIPRLYLKYENEDALLRLDNWIRSQGESLSKISPQDYLKNRKDIPKEVREAMGEIEDNPAYLLLKRGPVTAQDIFSHKWMNWVASSEHTLPTELGKRIDDMVRRGEALPDNIAHGTKERLFRGNTVDIVVKDGVTYRKIPDTKAYAKSLRGRYVEESIALDLQAERRLPGALEKLYLTTLSFFKRAKVTWNPATLSRNIMGQLPLTDLGGVHPWEVGRHKAAWVSYIRADDMYQEARRAGLFRGSYYKTEIEGLLRTARRTDADSSVHALTEWNIELARKFKDKTLGSMERFHAASDDIAKLTLYRHARERLGMSAEDAVRHAHKYAFNYEEVPRWIKYARTFGPPFITFSYKALPRVLESALALQNPRQMMRFWKYPAAFAAVNEASARRSGLIDEKNLGPVSTIKRVAANTLGLGLPPLFGALRTKEAFPQFMQEWIGDQQVLLPWRDEFGRMQQWDMTWTLPWGDLGEFGKGPMARNLGLEWFPRQLEPVNPAVQTAVAAFGRDLFTGKELAQLYPEDPPLVRQAKFMMQTWGPALLNPEGRSAQKIVRAMKEEVASPDTPSKANAVLSEVFGIKWRPLDPHLGAEIKMGAIKREIGRLKREIKQAQSKGRPSEYRQKQRQRLIEEYKILSKVVKQLPPMPPELVKAKKAQAERARKRLEAAQK